MRMCVHRDPRGMRHRDRSVLLLLIPTEMPEMLKVFQLGLGCLSRNRMAVTSCRGTWLSEVAEITTMSWEPDSQCGSSMRNLFWMLTSQSAGDLPELITLICFQSHPQDLQQCHIHSIIRDALFKSLQCFPMLMPSVVSAPLSLARLRLCRTTKNMNFFNEFHAPF